MQLFILDAILLYTFLQNTFLSLGAILKTQNYTVDYDITADYDYTAGYDSRILLQSVYASLIIFLVVCNLVTAHS